ncbi:unnamed protein product [Symbiodinium sp. KB8]|nr:unnamed protein product [Symbiodinium sp. KB8]
MAPPTDAAGSVPLQWDNETTTQALLSGNSKSTGLLHCFEHFGHLNAARYEIWFGSYFQDPSAWIDDVVASLCGSADAWHMAEDKSFEKQEADDLDTHASAGGDYSIEVRMTAVRSTAMTRYGRVCWRMRGCRAMDMADLDDCLGAVQNHQGKHWVALRRKGDSFLYLDSLSPDAHPRQSPEEEMVDRMLTYPTYAVELLHQYDEAVATGVMTRTARGQMLAQLLR